MATISMTTLQRTLNAINFQKNNPKLKGSFLTLRKPHQSSWTAENLLPRIREFKVRSSETVTEPAKNIQELKSFLEDLKTVGRVRIIVNTGMGVLESVTTLDGLFFQEYGQKGEYGNVMKSEDNVDFHLLLSKVASVTLEKTPSPFNGQIIRSVRLRDDKGEIGASLLVMWKPGTKGDYDDGQVEAFDTLLEKYGPEIKLR